MELKPKEKEMRDVQFEITKLLVQGKVIMTYKTKSKADGGKQLVSVGPYRSAIKDTSRKFVLIMGTREIYSPSATHLAKEFVAFVGRDLAWDATGKV